MILPEFEKPMRQFPINRHPFDIPPVYFGLAILTMVALDRWAPIVTLLDRPWTYLGVIGIVAGVGLAVWAARLFARAGTGVKPFTPSTEVVRIGPYRFTRNPMYLGMMIVLAGAVLLLGSLSPALVIPIFFWWIHNHFVLPEEQHMEHSLGQAYLDYKQSMRRWL